MKNMFKNATSFNQDIRDFDISNISDTYCMLCYAYEFNQDIGDWNISGVTDMSYTSIDSSSFNQDIGIGM